MLRACLLVRGLKIEQSFEFAWADARGRVSGSGMAFPSRRPCSDLAKLKSEAGPSAPKNCFGGVREPCGPGASRGEKDLAPLPRVAAVQEHCERLDEVRQGERQDGATVRASQALPGKLCPPRTAAKCSAIYEQARLTIAPP